MACLTDIKLAKIVFPLFSLVAVPDRVLTIVCSNFPRNKVLRSENETPSIAESNNIRRDSEDSG